MGIGKYLHRNKGDTPSPQQPNRQSRAISQGATDSALETSRYEATAPGSTPETGSYPIRGNNSTAAVTSRRGSIRNSMDRRGHQSGRPDTAPSHPAGSTAPRLATPPNNDFSDYHFFDQPHTSTSTRTQTTTTVFGGQHPTRQMEADSGLAQDFSRLSMNNDSMAGSATPPPISYYPDSGLGRLDPRVDSHPRNDPSIRMVNQSAPQQQYTSPTNYQRGGPGYYDHASRSPVAAEGSNMRPKDTGPYDHTAKSVPPRGSSNGYNENNDLDVRRRESIPRKQIGSSAHTPSSSVTSASPNTAGFPAQSRGQQAPPVPQHDMPLSQQSRYQDPSAATQQYSSSPRQAHHNMPSSQQSRYQDSTLGRQQYNYNPHQTQRDVPLSREGGNQEPSGAAQQYTHSRQRQSTTSRGEYSDYGSGEQQDGYVAPLAVRSKQTPRNMAREPAAEEILERAKTNTYDTEVIEKIAPAVVQETVQQKVHHVREEVITREIHTHDVFHRMLPVIDVEVLPPRHFLPVEGGGLVEIGADEVPGRGNNWVIAETASKIPSDQPAPKGARRFTARQFPGTEGDAVQYTTPEGYEHTETTWVHPPELETGGRDTGQTWPMVFGKESSSDGRVRTEGQSPAKHAKSRSKKRDSVGHATAAAQGTGQQYTSA